MDRADRLKLASVLLAYPGDDFPAWLEEAARLAEETADAEVSAAVAALRAMPMAELARCYVATFDMQETTALYLTAHELGDSRERGAALLRLHAMLRAAGLEPVRGELPDYLPLLLEFLAAKPAGMPTEALEKRLGTVCRAIAARLAATHPYRPLFVLVAACLPAQDTDAPSLSPVWDPDAESDALPYPLVYD
ncbi:nitrate reductase molybdenum cofactor assembly chaperone [Alicyclobacillus macrosporangiidus]|uniref:Nitrate reductase delta subunit n=1 Tax=Alicyclobacillus macrosporangiidus TaxID=392015 RepID=A0A1I7F5I3_9BACL|nr:nitrate reductase molybdenum cofactor assembly chaperone [Alicyclobacillus macrosporangiidus]SFU31443.1 nitrate reductase delta subunit [Alicyclobacillus macrosporangiidus]